MEATVPWKEITSGELDRIDSQILNGNFNALYSNLHLLVLIGPKRLKYALR